MFSRGSVLTRLSLQTRGSRGTRCSISTVGTVATIKTGETITTVDTVSSVSSTWSWGSSRTGFSTDSLHSSQTRVTALTLGSGWAVVSLNTGASWCTSGTFWTLWTLHTLGSLSTFDESGGS